MKRGREKTIFSFVMWGLGLFFMLYAGLHLGLEAYAIKGTIWIVGAILLIWMPNKE